MRITVEPVGRADISSQTLGESSADIAKRVRAARAIAEERFSGRGFALNSQIPARDLRSDFKPDRKALAFLHDELDRIHSNCVIINKQQAHTLIDDFDYVMQCVRDSASGKTIDWENVVCELGFGPYSVISEIKKQL